jgi:ATP-dependent DNA helicase RecQ
MIFVPTRASTEKIARVLRATGRRVVTYHGGMSSEERKNTEALIQNQAPQLIVSTSAFGMGMDYGHLNRVILWQIPTSILSLVQIMGRVGRGNNSQGRALCLWDSDDFKMMEWSIRGLQKRRIEVQELFHFYSTAQCRRSALKEYFQPNNSPFRCNQCDWCDQTSIFLQ